MSLPCTSVLLFAKSRSDVRQHPRLIKWIGFQINIIEQKQNSELQVDSKLLQVDDGYKLTDSIDNHSNVSDYSVEQSRIAMK